MSSEFSNTETSTSVIVEISPQTSKLVETELAEEDDEIKRETKALIEAIKRRAQAEIQSAGNLSRDAYLNAVRRARESVESNQLMVNPGELERSMQLIQKEAEKSWLIIASEIESLGIRLADEARVAWSNLMASQSGKH